MSVVAVTGVSGFIGQRLVARLEADPEVGRIVGLDAAEPYGGSPKLDFHRLDVRDARCAKALAGADVVVHLAFQHDPSKDADRMRSVNVDGTRNIVEASAAAGAAKFVTLSSATVYGAHPDNEFPLTEESPARPNADFAYAVHKLECERLVEAFRAQQHGIATIFRSAVAFGPSAENFVSRMMQAPRLLTVKGHAPPLQLVHEDDVAAAIAHAVTNDLDGVFNLAADGWLSADEIESLTGKKRVELPEAVAFSMAERLWRTGLVAAPPGELHYVMHPWVMDNAKLRATGWAPRFTNREALAEMHAAHRDWIALGRARVRKDSLAKGAAATLGAVGAMALVRRARRRPA